MKFRLQMRFSLRFLRFSRPTKVGVVLASVVLPSSVVFVTSLLEERQTKAHELEIPSGHVRRPDLPTFSIDEVKAHSTVETGLWVTFKGGVYDVTEFIKSHPGGADRIEMVGGTDLAIYWDIYRMHYRHNVLEFLEKYRIGNLTPKDAITMETEFIFPDPYEADPERPNPKLLHTLEKPFCGEPRLANLVDSFYTPNDLHYVRLHLPVPTIDEKEWSVTVKGNGLHGKEFKFSLDDLKQKFKHQVIACTLQCAGNRREDFNRDGHAVYISPNWRVAAISNAEYKGVYLRDVLKECGIDVDKLHTQDLLDPSLMHVQFEGFDATEAGTTYGVSIPIEKAVDPRGDVMLVWEMNGEPLPPDHGAPVRALVPGYVGNKSAKFLHEIILSSEISSKPWHIKSYRNFPPNVTFEEHLSHWDKLSDEFLAKGPIVYMMPVQSLVSQPVPWTEIGADTHTNSIKIKGVAWTGNGVGMARVDLSIDGGITWEAADFESKPEAVQQRETWNRKWSWTIFEKDFPLSQDMKNRLGEGHEVILDVVSKGVDNAFNVQPESIMPYYNARGVVINEWYHVPVKLNPKLPLNTSVIHAPTDEDLLNPPSGGHFYAPWKHHGWTSEQAKWHEDIIRQSETRSKH